MDNEFLNYTSTRTLRWFAVMLFAALAVITLRQTAAAQDQDDPPTRVARLGYIEGSVSFEPAGEDQWVQADANRPLTTGDKLWADKDSRAELQLGGATIRMGQNTGFSFLNLDDNTVQIQLTDGAINVRVRDLRGNDFEIDTPNQAFTISGPGSYRVEASEDGTYSVVTVRDGEGQSTGNGSTYTIHAGQRVTLSGTDQLNAEMEDIGQPDDFDAWADSRDHRWEGSRSARYVSRDMPGYDDLDDTGDWQPHGEYGNVWFPRVAVGWAPYHDGHWAWVDPWGWTWVDDAPWGYAPFHYGRWASIDGRWGWIPGPMGVAPVYAPALVAFVGGGGFAIGGVGVMAWFPLGPREVYVPSYHVSEAYVTQVNISNTTVSQTTVTNIYKTTIVNNSTTITNVTYANRNVRGAVTAVPQAAFASAQPVAKAAVAVTPQQIASAPIAARAAVAPTPKAVLGARADTAGHVAAPPKQVMSRPVVAKKTPPPPPPPFAARQKELAAHPGQPIPRQQLAKLAPPAARPMVKQAPPGKPATAVAAKPGQPARPSTQPNKNQPAANAQPNRPGNQPPANQPNRAGNPPTNERPGAKPAEPPARNDRPAAAQPNRPEPNKPAEPAARPPANRPESKPAEPAARPLANRPENKPAEPAAHPPANRPENKPAEPAARPPANRPENKPAEPAAHPANRPEANQPKPAEKKAPPPENRPQPKAEPPAHQAPAAQQRPPAQHPPAEAKPAPKARASAGQTADAGREAQGTGKERETASGLV